jgi:hypothetical protein
MEYKQLFIELITSFLDGETSREEVANKITMEIPVDSNYADNRDLMENSEWALRHINEPDYWTTEVELRYYLSCLKGDKRFSVDERNSLLDES